MPSVVVKPDPTEDSRWIHSTLKGDESAFSHLVRKYREPLFHLATRILGSPTEAEDALQDAFLEAYRHLGDFHFRSRFSTWLYSIVLNRVRNRLRQTRLLRWYSLDIRRTTRDGFKPPEIQEKGPAMDQLTEKKIELESIHQAVREFPKLYQSIFIRHYFQDRPLEEVARDLGRPLGTVKVYLHRARKLLQKKMKAREKARRFQLPKGLVSA